MQVKPTSTGSHILDVLEVLGLVPPSQLGSLLLSDKHNHRPQLRSGALTHGAGRKRSLEEAAVILKTTVHKVRRVLKVAKLNPAELEHTRWGKGQHQQPAQFTKEQQAWATGPQKLLEQVGLSIKARKDAFNQQFGQSISIPRFRRLYQEVGITK